MAKIKTVQLTILLFILTIYVWFTYFNVDYELEEQQPYLFSLRPYPENKFTIHDVLIVYDFKDESGNISFFFSSGMEDVRPNPFDITIPDELEVVEIEFTKDGEKLIKEKDFSVRNHTFATHNQVVLDNFNRSIVGNKVVMKLKGKLIPNALFDVNFQFNKAQTRNQDFFNFVIGDYACSSAPDCFSSSRDKYEGKRIHYFYRVKESTDDVLAVYKRNENGTEVEPKYEEFYLKLEPNKKLVWKKNLFYDFALVLSGTLVAWVWQLFFYNIDRRRDFFEENRNKIEKHKTDLLEKIKGIVERSARDEEKLKNLYNVNIKEVKSMARRRRRI